MDPKVTASIVTVLLLAGSLGGLLGGYLSDLVGRRKVIVVSFLLAAPFSFLLINSGGIWLWLAAGLAGATLLGSFSVLTIQAQELMPENVGMASGLMLGFAIGVGGISVGAASPLAERIGVGNTLNLMVLFPILSALIAMSLKDKPRPKALPLA